MAFKQTIKTEARVILLTDIHGCFEELQRKLQELEFSGEDILVIAGDAIDRGPDSMKVVRFIDENPNVHCIRGNHEDMAIEMMSSGSQESILNCVRNGGDWILDLNQEDWAYLATTLASWPMVIQIEKGGELYGVIHAEPDTDDWNTIGTRKAKELLWGRYRLSGIRPPTYIENVKEIYCGHTIVEHPTYTGNVFHMDLGAFLGNELYHVEL